MRSDWTLAQLCSDYLELPFKRLAVSICPCSFFTLSSVKYLELLGKMSLILAESGTDSPSSQYKYL
jgi:hypothetical protein